MIRCPIEHVDVVVVRLVGLVKDLRALEGGVEHVDLAFKETRDKLVRALVLNGHKN